MPLNRHWCRDSWIWIVIGKFEVFILEVKDILDFRIYLHFRQLARLATELEGNLFEMIRIDMSVTCSMDEFSRLKTAYLSYHHGQKSVGSDIEWYTKKYIRTALIELACKVVALL